MNKIVVLLIALIAIACQPNTDRWVADPALFIAGREAADQWCEDTDGEFCPAVVTSGDGYRMRVASRAMFVAADISNPDACAVHIAWPWPSTRKEIWVREENVGGYQPGCQYRDAATPEENLVGLLGHELGHYLGLKDNTDPDSYMCSNCSILTEPQAKDLVKLMGAK